MCGITGVIDLKSCPVSNGLLEKMTDVIAHRGPNDSGIFIENYIGFGHRRLSILDTSSAGHQPMNDESGNLTITYNGEVYNYLELKEELRKKKYLGGSDTEVILEAYKKWGFECLEHFNGIFSFGLWDRANKTLFCARDRIGVKPFYYAIYAGKLFFASEIKALLAAGVPALPDNKIIHDYLVYGVYEHSENTFFSGIKQLMPGHFLTVKDGNIKISCYWNLPDKIQNLGDISQKKVIEKYRELVDDAVKLQLRSDVPVGVNVSGGLDSSILTETINRICGGQRNFQMYSWDYGEKKYDETKFTKELAKYLGWDLQFITLTPRKAIEILPEVIRCEEQPFPGVSILARHNLYKHINPRTIVFLEGHGGDEIGGGYDYYISSFILDMLRIYGPEKAKAELKAFGKKRELPAGDAELQFLLSGLQAYFQMGTSADASRLNTVNSLDKDFVSEFSEKPAFPAPFESFLANMQYRDMCWTKEPRVLRSVDRNSMAYGKEVRVPFLDHRLVEFCFSLGPEYKIRNGEQRFFMREAFRDKLPNSNISIPKRSVPDPQRYWLKSAMRSFVEDIIYSPEFNRRPFFNTKNVINEYKKYCQTEKEGNSFHIWQWINLELWLREFID